MTSSRFHAITGDYTDLEQLEDEGWTDLHLHPVDPAFQLPIDELPGLARRLGIEVCSVASIGDTDDRWDAGEQEAMAEPIVEREDVPLDELMGLLATPGLRHVTLVVDAAAVGLLPVVAACQSRTWHPCLVSLSWGLTTIPDHQGHSEQARFHLDLVVGGPGLPRDAKATAEKLRLDPVVLEACARFGNLFGQPVAAHLAIGA
jgi:hypothetical protein